MEIEIHYNAFQTISEKLKDFEVEDVEELDKLEYYIFYLWLHDMLTDSQKDTTIKRLHKRALKSIKGKKVEDK